ncbi:MAG TPA: sigma-70 family RNA polymerase sigma factor [Gemmatales bacterium]|nr:sigma-70 family RNA polymerase sigma factor [Gemmatales bacterium]HMP16983.1 sigma-70 family RNA polymerase sigma factor [Gemmatales bacterium]
MKQPRPSLERNSDESDEAILARFCRGETSAFGELLHRFKNEIYSYLKRYLGQESLADDVFQNTFIQVYQKAGQFEEGRKVKPWLYAIATHQAIDMIRRHNRRPAVSLDQLTSDDEVLNWSDTFTSAEVNPLDGLELAERKEKVKEALESLPEHLKLTIIMAYYQGLKYKEIAEIMKIPVGTVKSRLHAAMQKLQEALRSIETART